MQHDRFARKILAILERDTTRSRRLMRNPFGHHYQTHLSVKLIYECYIINNHYYLL